MSTRPPPQRSRSSQRRSAGPRGRSSLRGRRLLGYAATYLVLIVAVMATLAPFAVSVLTAFTSSTQFAQQGPLSIPPSPPPTLENFRSLFSSVDGFITPVAVTLQMVAVILVGQMVLSVLAAYAFAHVRFPPGRDMLFWVFVATLMVPQVVVVVPPLYLMFAEAGLRNTFWRW